MTRALSGYESARHRCEVVREHGGHRYINDSKATNLHAVESCLRSQDAPVVLIAGGKEKGIDYAPFRPLLREKVSALVAIGEIGGQLQRSLRGRRALPPRRQRAGCGPARHGPRAPRSGYCLLTRHLVL